MKSLLKGKSVLVTGAARGIGLAVAEAIIAAGGTVAMADIDEAEVRAQARRLNSIAVVMDVSDNGAVKSGVEQAAKALGTIDGLVNNAAMLDESHAALVTEHRFEKVISTNLTSILRVAQRVLPYLSQSGGSIVNTLSTQAMFGQANSVAYATAKGGGLNLTRAMAIDLAPV
jgi:NAD(P)-dependent dehydrogenase (short-subunit alcohol dehydrogenase family)